MEANTYKIWRDRLQSLRLLTDEGLDPMLLCFSYRVRIPCPLAITNYSGHLTNAIAKALMASEEPTKHLISVTPLARNRRYITQAFVPISPGLYNFSITCPAGDMASALKLAKPSHMSIEGIRCPIEGIEFQSVSLETLRSPPSYPESFSLSFLTPTRMAKKVPSREVGRAVYELLPTPRSVFSSLARLWNEIAPEGAKIELNGFLEWVSSSMFITPPFKLSSMTLRLDKKRLIPGFVGSITYSSIEPSSYNHAIAVILSRLSQYTGVGLGRRMGLGRTRYEERPSHKQGVNRE